MTEKNGLEILIINISMMGDPPFTLDITRQDVEKVSAVILATLAYSEYKDWAMRVMAAGHAVMWDQNVCSGWS